MEGAYIFKLLFEELLYGGTYFYTEAEIRVSTIFCV